MNEILQRMDLSSWKGWKHSLGLAVEFEFVWKLALILGIPGELILLLYSIKEINILLYSLGYIILILSFSYLGASLGKRVKTK